VGQEIIWICFYLPDVPPAAEAAQNDGYAMLPRLLAKHVSALRGFHFSDGDHPLRAD